MSSRGLSTPPSFGHRRYVVAARYVPRAMVSFDQPTTLEQAQSRVEALAVSHPVARAGVFELRLVKR
jgi:hypothetical protein